MPLRGLLRTFDATSDRAFASWTIRHEPLVEEETFSGMHGVGMAQY